MTEFNVNLTEDQIERLDNYYFNSDLCHVYKRHRVQIISILNCVEEINTNKKISDFNLNILEEGIRNSWEEVFYYQAGKFLVEFSYHYENANQLFYKLAEDKDYKVRFRILTILLHEPKKKIIKDLLQKAFTDKSTIVREKAEDVLNRLNAKKRFLKIKI